MINKRTRRCWPAGNRSKSAWRVAARGGAGHASDTWRAWMEPVRPHSRQEDAGLAKNETWRDAARMAGRDEGDL